MTLPQDSLPERILRWIKAHRNAVVAIVFWLVVILLTRQFMQANNLSFNDLIDQLRVLLVGTWYGPLLYIGVYLLRPLILFPAWLLTILGGSTFGLAAGFVYVLIGGTLSSAIPYVVGRWFSTGEDDSTRHDSRLHKFIAILRRNPFQTVLLMRLLYLPYDGVSIFAGSLRIPALAFFVATAAGNLGGTLSFVGIGSALEADITSGDITVNPASLLLSVVIFIVSMVISYALNRIQQRKQALLGVPQEANLD